MSKEDFIARSTRALGDDNLQQALATARAGFVQKRKKAIAAVDDFEALRTRAEQVRQRSLEDLHLYLAIFEKRVTDAGGQVHWAPSTGDLCDIVVQIAKAAQAKTISKGKSMVSEEARLNQALEDSGFDTWETDLGEYILQLAGETPSHIVAPALHKRRSQVRDLFAEAHNLGSPPLNSVKELVDEARQVLRQHFLAADIGITGANILIAETGTSVLCTNEGNGDLCASLPDTHIIVTSIDKVVSSWEDASAILRVLARSATGQSITTYTSFYGPRQKADLDGPTNFHVVILDGGRSELLGSGYHSILQCIKCGACLNHCPIYQNIGGHAYDSVYPGPMGSVLTPLLRGRDDDFTLAHASTFCGHCEEVCPVKIPLPELLRKLRQDEAQSRGTGWSGLLIKAFAWLARRPRLYRLTTTSMTSLMACIAGRKRRLTRFPGLGRWLGTRDLPAPEGKTFQQQWRKRQRNQHGGE